ncbi:DUF2817 domain-containing protein [Planctomicrobium sp. SH664]|uniref:DUF2817 domain-containing protein n=1 Tax=Planctomicrobium sp. SH664 TaxID=3448125 RepID=UPI003F5C9427
MNVFSFNLRNWLAAAALCSFTVGVQAAARADEPAIPEDVEAAALQLAANPGGDFSLGNSQPFPQPGNPVVQQPAASTGAPIVAVNQTQTQWISNTQSTGRRPIEVARIGKGPQAVLIVGSIYGNEPEAIDLIDSLVKVARSSPVPPEFTLLFIRTPNPDGFTELVRTNANGVDLNRNFPSQRFTPKPTKLTGPSPASEVETQYLLRVFKDYPTARVIHLRSGYVDRPYVVLNEKWSATLNGVAPRELTTLPFTGEYKAGSLEEYAAVYLQAPLAIVHLSAGRAGTVSASDFLRFATAPAGSAAPRQDQLAAATREPAAGSSFTPGSEPQVTTDGNKGEVEFLPSPSQSAAAANPVKNAATDARFFELPAPPRGK